ncbi:MAG: hypothetical protein H0U53_02725 [Actinobacteria bacterium]|nr:hypothetical protein [Actinomycetota bacterium]
MFPIIYAVLASFALGAVAGVAITWAMEQRRRVLGPPRTGIPAPTPLGSEVALEEYRDELAAKRLAA